MTDREVGAQRILVVDDQPANVRLLADRLAAHGYAIETAGDGAQALACIGRAPPDLILLDVQMPRLDGLQALERIRSDRQLDAMPVVMVTALDDRAHRLRALDLGADDFLSKPVDAQELLARVRSLLRIRRLVDKVQRQSAELQAWNEQLEDRVKQQVVAIERLSRLKRFFSPRLSEMLLADGEDQLVSHRREIVVVFLDLRGWSTFAETAAPEDVMGALAEFHRTTGSLIDDYEGTLERFTGDGMMVFFNDPVPVDDAAARALSMALQMQVQAARLAAYWRLRDFDLGLGIGIAQGYATLGRIGYEHRIDYAAIGAVTNLAQRLCAMSDPGEILVARRVLNGIEADFAFESRGAVQPRGFTRSFEVVRLTGGQLSAPARSGTA